MSGVVDFHRYTHLGHSLGHSGKVVILNLVEYTSVRFYLPWLRVIPSGHFPSSHARCQTIWFWNDWLKCPTNDVIYARSLSWYAARTATTYMIDRDGLVHLPHLPADLRSDNYKRPDRRWLLIIVSLKINSQLRGELVLHALLNK